MPPRKATFDTVRKIGLAMPDVEESTAYGSPALKVKGKMFACVAINKAAEPNSLVVRVPFAQRDEMIAVEPGVYYLKDHYEPYPAVLVRLSRIHPDALRDLLHLSARFVGAGKKRRSDSR
jgi:hypothetical protein